jgi:molybdate transport system ATP-binding protein
MLLAAEGIVAERGSFRLHVNALHVERGEVLAVIGPNGAGKSTLFRILALADDPGAGTVRLDGRVVGTSDAAARRSIAAVFQRPHLFAGTVADNMHLGLRARGVTGRTASERVASALAAVGLDTLADADVRRISGGEAQRLAVARALVLEPDLLLLDEPAAALDAFVRTRLISDLERLVRGGNRGVVLITHDPREAFALADRVAILEAGSLRQVGTPADLLSAPATPYVAALTGAELLMDGIVEEADGDFVRVALKGGQRIVALAPAGGVRSGAAVHVAYRPGDVSLGEEGAFDRTSVLNRLQLRVREVRQDTGGLVRVRLDGPPEIVAVVSARSGAALAVEPGRTVDVALRATALHTFTTA